jgi:hypothetical protein
MLCLKKLVEFEYNIASNFPILTFYFSTFHPMEFQNTKSG